MRRPKYLRDQDAIQDLVAERAPEPTTLHQMQEHTKRPYSSLQRALGQLVELERVRIIKHRPLTVLPS